MFLVEVLLFEPSITTLSAPLNCIIAVFEAPLIEVVIPESGLMVKIFVSFDPIIGFITIGNEAS